MEINLHQMANGATLKGGALTFSDQRYRLLLNLITELWKNDANIAMTSQSSAQTLYFTNAVNLYSYKTFLMEFAQYDIHLLTQVFVDA